MYKAAINFLRGNVQLELESDTPERMVNLCAAHRIPFWDLEWLTPRTVRLHTTRSGAREIRRLLQGQTAELHFGGERGAPKMLGKLRRRRLLVAGLALFAALLVCSNLFVWDFEVSGNEKVSTQTILRALERYGVTIGSVGFAIDQDDLRNHVLLELDDVLWLAVNMKGCTAHVQVVERQNPPQMLSDDEKCNIVAKKAGLVTKVEALDGEALVTQGSTVTAGQLLISGVVDSDFSGMRLLHSLGNVWARTWYDLTVDVPLTVQKKTVTKKSTHLALNLGKHRINLYVGGSVTDRKCDKITKYKPLLLPGGLRLPITLVQEQITCYELAPSQRSTKQAKKLGEQMLNEALQQQLGDDGTVSKTKISTVEKNGKLSVTLHAECVEQIGESVTLAQQEIAGEDE